MDAPLGADCRGVYSEGVGCAERANDETILARCPSMIGSCHAPLIRWTA